MFTIELLTSADRGNDNWLLKCVMPETEVATSELKVRHTSPHHNMLTLPVGGAMDPCRLQCYITRKCSTSRHR